MLIYVPDQPPS
uniref:Uncharacterized protein n=1 Tax=Solanum lycopersicum TaxID=4081 RepID=A0A3Q7FDM5_SOLLC